MHYSECWHTSSENVKIIKIKALKNMYKNMVQARKMADIESVADPKIMADGKITAPNHGR